MRVIVRVAVWVSVAVVVALVLLGMAAISELNEPGWFGSSEGGKASLWWGVALGLYYSSLALPVDDVLTTEDDLVRRWNPSDINLLADEFIR